VSSVAPLLARRFHLAHGVADRAGDRAPAQLPRQTPDRFLIVNIPEFRLLAFESGQEGPVLSSDVVVGSAARRFETPILHAEMEYIVFRPYWNVPPSIARKELMPKADSDPGYLARNNMETRNGRIRQRPGDDNSLGLVKFVFPNRHHVYLHDTPSKALFDRSRRDFSHGCIRVARPADLAEFLLRGQDSWTKERVVDAMQKGRNNRHVQLETPVPVYLLYATVMVGRNGELRFFEDIYGHDAELRKSLAKGPPYP
jgi:murein L,D-transpeptidase YcbB/YkuD